MIPRYTHPEMGRIWSDQRRYETWLLVDKGVDFYNRQPVGLDALIMAQRAV